MAQLVSHFDHLSGSGHLTLKMALAHVVQTSVIITISPSHYYTHPDHHNDPILQMCAHAVPWPLTENEAGGYKPSCFSYANHVVVLMLTSF